MSCFKNTLTTRILCTITHKTVVHNIDMTFQTFPSCKLLATFNTIYFIFLWILPSCLFKWFILEMLELQCTQLYCFCIIASTWCIFPTHGACFPHMGHISHTWDMFPAHRTCFPHTGHVFTHGACFPHKGHVSHMGHVSHTWGMFPTYGACFPHGTCFPHTGHVSHTQTFF